MVTSDVVQFTFYRQEHSMNTNDKGYPIQKIGNKWVVGEYTETPKGRVQVFTNKKAAERVAAQWNWISGAFK